MVLWVVICICAVKHFATVLSRVKQDNEEEVSSSSAVFYLLGFLSHHEHEIKVVRSQRVFVQVVDVDEEEKVLQRLFSTHSTGSFRRVHWTNTQTQRTMRN